MERTELAFGRIPAYRKYELHMERYRSAAEIIRSRLDLTDQTRILDVGSGEGKLRYFFDADEGQWFGVEYDDRRLKICEELGYEMVQTDLNNTRLPYPDHFFDIVFASHVIEHLSDIDFSVREMDRVLKPGGLLLVATPTKPPVIAGLMHRWHKSKKKAVGQTQNAFSSRSLQRFLGERLPQYRLIDSRGFRILSARKKLKLEDSYAFYRVSVFLGRYLTAIVPEVSLIYQKKAFSEAAPRLETAAAR